MTTNTERCGGEVEAYRSPGDVGEMCKSVNAKQDAIQQAVDIYSIWKSNEARHGGNLHRLMRAVYDAWEVDRLSAALAEERAKGERMAAEQSELYGCLQFILAFYEPGQRHLDTEAWKVAEKAARYAMKTIKRADAPRRALASS